MEKLELLKIKAEIANLRRIADTLSEESAVCIALIERADKLEKEIVGQ